VVIWYIFPVLVFCIKKNLATLFATAVQGGQKSFTNNFFSPTDFHPRETERRFEKATFPAATARREATVGGATFWREK
jgi:hypothetical protein